ncbi:nuclear transport factor 2 family protein [Sphingorhabdus sp.]|jgi:gamma-hexachlorocyclohexane dehydrochlorinase|uniref:nuclear transport factor 2 family protein n=1 Tax=Sphingorhabdus sp. TaxID=1902408 RepID=UPI0037CBA3DB
MNSLTRLENMEDFRRLVADYCIGFDKRQIDRFASIWWEDCEWIVGPPFGVAKGISGIKSLVVDVLWPAWKVSTHYTTNLAVDYDGDDAANGICDVYCIGNLSDGQATSVSATYTDRFERRGGVWKIAARAVTMHHFSPLLGITLSPPEG